MLNGLLLWLLLVGFDQDVAFKPKDEFEIAIKFELRQKPMADKSTIDFTETFADQMKQTSTSLPYLIVDVKFLKVREEEFRVKAFEKNGSLLYNKKLQEGLTLPLDLGYTDDLKDGVTSNEFRIITYSSERKELFLIHLKIEEDGNFLVNGVPTGKF